MKSLLAQIAIQEAPAVIDWIRSAFVKAHPNAPVPTDAEIIAAELQAFVSSLAKDEAWLAAHPS